MVLQGIPAINGKALHAFRNNDFTPESAIAELADNSIQAKCKNMKIRLTFGKIGQKTRPTEIAFGDDGIGMDKEVLQKCLVLGESTRTNDRNGIGRFGVGMTNGAISLCNKIQVYSREKQGNWHFIELDLKKVNDNDEPLITVVKEIPSLPENYKDLVGDFGTLVIWSDIDRIGSNFKTEYLRYWLARTFRKFIGDKIIENGKVVANPKKITFAMDVIGESSQTDGSREIHAFDPLYLIPNKERAADATAKLIDDWSIDFEVNDIDAPDDGTKIGKVRIRMSFTPKEWRAKEGLGGSPENTARHIKDNEGISILRKSREVSFNKIPFWTPTFKDKDRWWSCEIDFDPVLDFQFSVKNIKVGARPQPELRTELETEINPTRKDKVAIVDEIWKKAKAKGLLPDPTDPITPDRPSDPNQPKDPKPQKPLTPEEKKKIEEELKKKKLREEEQIAILKRIQDPESPPILLHERFVDVKSTDDYIEVESMGNKTIVWMNMNHSFFQNLYEKINKISELSTDSKDPVKGTLIDIASDLKMDIDNILISYISARNVLIKLDEINAESHENLIYHQSKTLKKLYDGSNDKSDE